MTTALFPNLDIFFLGIAITSILVLGYVVFFNNQSSITNKTFLSFAILTVVWSISNFLVPQFSSSDLVIWILRISIFIAVWHAFSFFQLMYVFPEQKIKLPKPYLFVLVPVIILTSILTLTPFVFSTVDTFNTEGEVSRVINGPGIAIFGLLVTGLVLSGLFKLFQKMFHAKGEKKVRFRFVLVGSFLTFFLLLTFNFIFPALLDNAEYVSLGALFILPFCLFTAYAIIKYNLLDIRMIATELLAFVLAIITLFEVLLSESLGALILRISIFLLVLIFGISLIKSVRKEVQQRRELEALSKDLTIANRQLKKLDKAKSEFLSIASHQLRTPLTIVKGYMSMITEGTYGEIGERVKKPILNVFNSNERLIDLVNDLLNLSRIESGKIQMKLKNMTVTAIVDDVLGELELKAKKKGLELIVIKPKAKIPAISIDEEKIRNAIFNIVDNAIKYTKKGSITVTTKQIADVIQVSIIDTGAGMTKEEISSLFVSFTRGKAGVKSNEGAGLGLYIAKQFVLLHKGKVWVESEGKGKGSTFFINLPIKKL
tara:strand:- start:424 stop:2052 length:1629 start_codon:yes stop_codon:yes gene_type:complete